MANQNKFNSELEVTQTVSLGSVLNVTGTTTFNDQFAIVATDNTVSIVATGVSITASTTITGAVELNGTVTISGTTTITGGTLAVNGDTTITGTVQCTGLQLTSPSDELSHIFTHSQSINFGSIAGNSVATLNVTIADVSNTAFTSVLVDTPDILNDAFIIQGTVVADETIGLKLHNTSNGTENAITATFEIVVFQFT